MGYLIVPLLELTELTMDEVQMPLDEGVALIEKGYLDNETVNEEYDNEE
jgi:hypothetical protein